MALASIVGLVLALGRRSRYKIARATTEAFVEFVRSTPLLVQLFFVFYALPFYGLILSPFTAGVVTIGIHYSTYTAEVYRAGIEAIPKSQWEAAIALNLSKSRTFIRIILPQAIPPMIPALGNYLVGMFKETAQLSAITVIELLHSAKTIMAHTFRFVEPFTLVGILFLAVSFSSALLIQKLEDRFGREKR
jgi:polar amino acid transport system permease protein